MYQSAYLIGALIFGLVWLIFFWRRPDLRREMIVLSLLAGVMGPLSEHFYLQDYWQPRYWFPASIKFEDFLAGFFLGGISAVGYEVIWRRHHSCACDLKTTWVLPLATAVGLISLIGLFHGLGVNSIYASILSFLLTAGIILTSRRDLWPAAVGSGLTLAAVMFIFYLIYQRIYPGIIQSWWRLKNISGILLLGVPIEELVWGFSWGLVAGPLYEFAAKVRLQDSKGGDKK